MSKLLVVPLEALTDSALTDPERRVLFSLYSFRGRDTGLVWPSVEAIAERANIRDKTWISKLTKSLCEKGWLEKKRRGFSGRNSYQICFPDRLADDETEGDLASVGVVESEEKHGSVDAVFLGSQSKLDAEPKSAVNTESDTFLGSQSKLDSEPNTFLGSQSNSYLGSQSKYKEQTIEQTNEQGKKKNNIKKSDPDFSAWPSIPSPEVWADYKKLRQAKKAPVSATVLAAMAGELKKLVGHGVGVDQALRVCCERGWQGLKCEWVLNHLGRGAPPPGRQQFQTAAEKRAARNREIFDYETATNF